MPEFSGEILIPLGGTLGFYCHHAYAHANDNHRDHFPFALKGVDAVFYSVFHFLGLEVTMKAVLDQDDLDNSDAYGRDYDSDDSRKDAELVATGLHGNQLTEEGGCDGSDNIVDVMRHLARKSSRSPILTCH